MAAGSPCYQQSIIFQECNRLFNIIIADVVLVTDARIL
jgi:hypothetical protein